jgi:hypothetical protein
MAFIGLPWPKKIAGNILAIGRRVLLSSGSTNALAATPPCSDKLIVFECSGRPNAINGERPQCDRLSSCGSKGHHTTGANTC